MNADLRDKIAAALYLFTEEADQGTPGWDELIANHGDDYEAVVAYRKMADFVMPTVEAACVPREQLHRVMAWRDELGDEVRAKCVQIDRLRIVIGEVTAVLNDDTIHATKIRERALAVLDPSPGVADGQGDESSYPCATCGSHDKSCEDSAAGCCDSCRSTGGCTHTPPMAGHEQGGEVLVEGSWFKRDDLPRILANHMRSLAEAEQSLKEMAPLTAGHEEERELRRQIARDIQTAKPAHLTRDYNAVDQAYDTAARIARGDS